MFDHTYFFVMLILIIFYIYIGARRIPVSHVFYCRRVPVSMSETVSESVLLSLYIQLNNLNLLYKLQDKQLDRYMKHKVHY